MNALAVSEKLTGRDVRGILVEQPTGLGPFFRVRVDLPDPEETAALKGAERVSALACLAAAWAFDTVWEFGRDHFVTVGGVQVTVKGRWQKPMPDMIGDFATPLAVLVNVESLESATLVGFADNQTFNQFAKTVEQSGKTMRVLPIQFLSPVLSLPEAARQIRDERKERAQHPIRKNQRRR